MCMEPYLQSSLCKGVVGGEGGWEDRRDHEGQDVQAVQQDLRHRTLQYVCIWAVQQDLRLRTLQYVLYVHIWAVQQDL